MSAGRGAESQELGPTGGHSPLSTLLPAGHGICPSFPQPKKKAQNNSKLLSPKTAASVRGEGTDQGLRWLIVGSQPE